MKNTSKESLIFMQEQLNLGDGAIIKRISHQLGGDKLSRISGQFPGSSLARNKVAKPEM